MQVLIDKKGKTRVLKTFQVMLCYEGGYKAVRNGAMNRPS